MCSLSNVNICLLINENVSKELCEKVDIIISLTHII